MSAKAGTLRGLHFQHPPHAELKLVSCLRGQVYDVAFDPTLAGSPVQLSDSYVHEISVLL
jgi:dTDP-4-dehydrorhamnose 3,5-epimerase